MANVFAGTEGFLKMPGGFLHKSDWWLFPYQVGIGRCFRAGWTGIGSLSVFFEKIELFHQVVLCQDMFPPYRKGSTRRAGCCTVGSLVRAGIPMTGRNPVSFMMPRSIALFFKKIE